MPLDVLSDGWPIDRPRPSTSLRCCSCDGGRKLLKCCPQRARRRLPLGGRLACIRIRRRPANEHACRPNSCRLMLGEHTSITSSIAAHQPSQQEQRVAHERGTSASSFAIVRLHVTSGYPYASVVCMGPGSGPLSVYGRCVVLISLSRGSMVAGLGPTPLHSKPETLIARHRRHRLRRVQRQGHGRRAPHQPRRR